MPYPTDHHTPERLRWLRIQSWKWAQTQPDDWAAIALLVAMLTLVLAMVLP